MSILAESNNNNNSTPTNARPLLYSTLRKKPALKNTTTNTVPTNTGPLATTTSNTTSTFGAPNPLEQQQQPWNTATANIITTASTLNGNGNRLLTHPQHYHPQHHPHHQHHLHPQQQQQQIMPMTTMTTSSPPTIIDYGLTLPSSMMPPSQSSIPVITTTTTGGTLPRKGILSNRHSTGSGILRNANTQTAMIISEEEDDNNGNGGLMIISSGGGPGPGPGHPSNVVAFVDNRGDIGGGGGGGGGYVTDGYGDTNEEDGKEVGSFSTMRRVVPVFSAGTINGSGGSATPLLITRFEEQGLEMLELEHPGRRQQQQQQHQPGHTEPKTLSTSLNNFFM